MTEPLPIEDLASLPSFHHPAASPDGDAVAVYYDESGRNELHLLDPETGEREQLSDGDVPRNARWPVSWSADGERVYFHMDDGGNEQNDIHAIDRDGGVETVVSMDGQLSLTDVGEDERTLLLGGTAGGQMNHYVHDLESDETEKLTDHDRAAGGGVLDPACERAAYSTNESDDFDNQDVFVVDLDEKKPENLEIGETGAEASPSEFGPDGDTLLVSDNTNDFSRCGVYDFESGDVTWYGDLDADERPVGFTDDGDRFLALRVEDAAISPVVYDVDSGDRETFDLPTGVAAFASSPFLGDERVLLSQTTPSERAALLAYDLETGETETLIEPAYGEINPETFVDADYFRFESHDGLDIGAIRYDSGERPSPGIVHVHGGPRAQDFRSFNLYDQFLLSRGYSVLHVNYRGSSGRGREFAERLLSDWGGGEQEDIAAGARLLRDEDWIDEDRVAVMGGSYGGYSAYWQMVQYPELYAAGVAWVGVTDLFDMFENTMPHFQTELMEKYLGTPDENEDLYRERSPVEYVENLDSPLLMIHGVNDRRVPVSQARIFRDALDDAGFEEGDDYEYHELGEEGHGSSDIQQKIRTFEILDDFLDRRL